MATKYSNYMQTVRPGKSFGLPYDTTVIFLPKGYEITVIPHKGTGLMEVLLWDADDNGIRNKIIADSDIPNFIQECVTTIVKDSDTNDF